MQAIAVMVVSFVVFLTSLVVHHGPATPGAHRALRAEFVPSAMLAADANDVVREYCVGCHSDRRMTGNLSLEDFDLADLASVPTRAETGERMVVKLRAGMMPPAGATLLPR